MEYYAEDKNGYTRTMCINVNKSHEPELSEKEKVAKGDVQYTIYVFTYFLFCFVFWPCHTACRILVP